MPWKGLALKFTENFMKIKEDFENLIDLAQDDSPSYSREGMGMGRWSWGVMGLGWGLQKLAKGGNLKFFGIQ